MNHVKFNRGNKILSKNASECIKKVQIISAKIASIYKAVYGTTRFQFFTIYCILILFFFYKGKNFNSSSRFQAHGLPNALRIWNTRFRNNMNMIIIMNLVVNIWPNWGDLCPFFILKRDFYFWWGVTYRRELISHQVLVYALLSDFEIIWGQTFAMMDDSGCCGYE